MKICHSFLKTVFKLVKKKVKIMCNMPSLMNLSFKLCDIFPSHIKSPFAGASLVCKTLLRSCFTTSAPAESSKTQKTTHGKVGEGSGSMPLTAVTCHQKPTQTSLSTDSKSINNEQCNSLILVWIHISLTTLRLSSQALFIQGISAIWTTSS